jgi:hypothetical protein
MSNGTLQQLSSKGVQDGHLSIAPETSLFKRTFKRVSNYAIESIDQEIPSAAWGKSTTVQISRNGDLISEVWMHMNIKLANLNAPGADTVRWTNVLGHAMFTDLHFEIGTTSIQRLTYDYLEILHELTSTSDIDLDELVLRSESAAQLVEWTNNGNTIDSTGAAVTQLWVKLPWWFTRARSQSLPIISLQYHDVRIKYTLRTKESLLVYSNSSNTTLDSTFNGDISNAVIVMNFVFLDSMERRLFAANSSEYLISTIQVEDFGVKTAGSTKLSVQVTFNHPTTALYWYVRKESHVTAKDYLNFERTDGFGDDTITSATIKFNGAAREKARGPLYFRKVTTSLYWPRTPRKNLYAYSFSQHPTAWFPSGSVNLSRIDTTALELGFPSVDANGSAFGEATVVIIAENFNVIRIQGGMCALD